MQQQQQLVLYGDLRLFNAKGFPLHRLGRPPGTGRANVNDAYLTPLVPNEPASNYMVAR